MCSLTTYVPEEVTNEMNSLMCSLTTYVPEKVTSEMNSLWCSLTTYIFEEVQFTYIDGRQTPTTLGKTTLIYKLLKDSES